MVSYIKNVKFNPHYNLQILIIIYAIAFDYAESEDEAFGEDIESHSLDLKSQDQSIEINPTTPLEHELLKKLRLTEERLFNTEVRFKTVEIVNKSF